MSLVIGLALVAAVLNAAAALLQQQGIQAAIGTGGADAVRIARSVPRMAREVRWRWGWFVDLLGYLCQAAALHLGSVALVQPLLSTQLLFTLLVVSWQHRSWPRAQAWLGAGGICTGLALLLVVQGSSLSGEADRAKVLAAAAVAAAVVAALVVLSRRLRCGGLLSAVAAGLCTAMSAVFTKLTVDDLATVGIAGTVQDWPGYLLIVSTVAGFLTIQAGFASEPLTWTVAAGLVTDPLASYLVGILAFDVSLPTDPASLAVIVASDALLVAGIAALAHLPTIADQLRPVAAPRREQAS